MKFGAEWLTQYPLPVGWTWATVRELGREGEQPVLTGPFGSNLKNTFVPSGIPVLTIGCLTDSGIDTSKAMHVSEETARDLEKYHLRAGDFLFSRMASVGRAGLVPSSLNGALFNYHIMRLRLSAEHYHPLLFLSWVKGAPTVREYLKRVNHGATRDGINTDQLLELPVAVPPIAEQRRIVAKLDALLARNHAAKKSLQRVPAMLDRLRQAILAAAFRGDLSSRWRETTSPGTQYLPKLGGMTPANSLPRSKREATWDERVLVLPTAWSVAKLSALVDSKRGITYGIVQTGEPTPSGIPTVRCGDVKGFKIQRSTLKLVAPEIAAAYDRTALKGGEVLIAIRGTVGEVAIADEQLAGCNISREVAMVPVAAPMLAKFIMYYLASPQAQQFIAADIKGVAQSGINLADLRELPVPIASIAEQREVIRQIEVSLGVIDHLKERVETQIQQLHNLERASFAAAFRGELVPQDPSDEPASVLLERIRSEREAAQPVKRKRSEKTSAPAGTRSSKRAP